MSNFQSLQLDAEGNEIEAGEVRVEVGAGDSAEAHIKRAEAELMAKEQAGQITREERMAAIADLRGISPSPHNTGGVTRVGGNAEGELRRAQAQERAGQLEASLDNELQRLMITKSAGESVGPETRKRLMNEVVDLALAWTQSGLSDENDPRLNDYRALIHSLGN